MFIFLVVSFTKMASTRLRDQDRLDGALTYCIWKGKMHFLLDEHGLKTYAERFVEVSKDSQSLEKYNKEMAKGKKLILDGVQDHIVSHLAYNNMAKEMWDVVVTLF